MNISEAPDRQGTLSPEDIQARLGKLTASRMKDAMDFLKNGQPSEKRKAYMFELVAERMTDVLVPHFVTPAMAWGIENEAAAKLAYVAATGNEIQQAGFIDHPEIDLCGATPDAYVSPQGLLECKCPTTAVFLRWVMSGLVPAEHRPQMGLQLLCTGRKFVDFCAFDPRMPESRRLFIRRYVPTAEELAKVEAAAKQFLAETEALFMAVTESELIGQECNYVSPERMSRDVERNET